ncbi:unnamed protein product [Symbiodinium microadriaticum]|nr:unnamed protein product [Symbiodinium microadriaticum]CAE7371617.1 unnamed protein product [Symbiodinium sp. KB8]
MTTTVIIPTIIIIIIIIIFIIIIIIIVIINTMTITTTNITTTIITIITIMTISISNRTGGAYQANVMMISWGFLMRRRRTVRDRSPWSNCEWPAARKQWNLHYAGRIRFIVKDADGESRCLRAHLDPVPLTPAVVVLEASVGSVLQPLAGVLREHGHLSPATVEKRLREEVEDLLKEAEARKEGRYYRPRQTGVSTERPWREIPLCLSDATLSGMKFKRRDSAGAGRKKIESKTFGFVSG